VVLFPPERCDVSAYLSQTSQHLGLGSDFAAKLDDTEGPQIAGECSTPGPDKIFDNTFEFRLPFDLRLTTIPEPTDLGPGGGEPGKALVALVGAIQAKDWDTVSRHIPKADVPAGKPTNADLIIKGLALNYPTELQVTEGLIKGTRALLLIRGKDKDGKKIKGHFSLSKDEDLWRVETHALFFDLD
jgi:hypothetical protein